MQTIFLTIGIAGCGKTTAAFELMKKEPKRWKRVNRDDIRMMNDGYLFRPGEHERESFVTKVSTMMIKESLAAGFDVIVDNTNLDAKARRGIHDLAANWGDVLVIEKVFEVPLEVILKQNSQRSGESRVPDDVIHNMAKKAGVSKNGKFQSLVDRTIYYPPKVATATLNQQDQTLPKAVICDLDGTLAIIHHRNPYDAARCADDELNEQVAAVLRGVSETHKIIFMSGRQDKFRPQTLEFFRRNIPTLEYEMLLMRESNDMRKDTVIKRELYENHVAGKYNVDFVIDDRPSVVRMWRHDLGFLVFQLDDREF